MKLIMSNLRRCRDLLANHGEQWWSGKIDRLLDASERDASIDVAATVQTWFGGMGSLSDLVICEENGHCVAADEVDQVNEQLSQLRSSLYDQTRTACRSIMTQRLLTEELCRYLMRLQALLQQRGASALADEVQFVSRFAVGSTTELYAESEKVLRTILQVYSKVLREQELNELSEVLERINIEFRMIGGA